MNKSYIIYNDIVLKSDRNLVNLIIQVYLSSHNLIINLYKWEMRIFILRMIKLLPFIFINLYK